MTSASIEWLAGVSDFCRRHAVSTLIAALLLTAGCIAYGWSHMAISTDTDELLSKNLPFARAQSAFSKAFPESGNSIVIILDGNTVDTVEDAAVRLDAWLGAHHDGIGRVFDPGQESFFRKNGLLYLDVQDLKSLAARLTVMQPMLARLAGDSSLPGRASLIDEALKRDASGENQAPAELGRVLDAWGQAIIAAQRRQPFIFPWQEIVTGSSSIQGRRRIIEVTPHLDFSDVQPAAGSIDLVRQGIRELHLDPAHGVRARLTGEAMLDYEQLQGAMSSAGLATGLSALLVLVLLFIALRNALLVLAVAVTLTMSLVWTSAFALFATAPLNLISVSFAVLFIGIGVDFGIQFCMRCLHESAAGLAYPNAIRRTAGGMGAALGLSATAAAASFFSFTPTDYKGLADLGIIAGSGMFIALAGVFTVLPALMGLMRLPRGRAPVTNPEVRPARMGERIEMHAKSIAVTAALLTLLSLAPSLHLRFDFNPLHLLDANNPAFKAFRSLASESKASPYAIDILEPNLLTADRVAENISKLDTVASTVTASSLIPDNQPEKLSILDDLSLVMPPFTLQAKSLPPSSPQAIASALQHLQNSLEDYTQHAGNKALTPHATALASRLADFLRSADADTLQGLDRNLTDGLVARIKDLSMALSPEQVEMKSLPDGLKARFLAADGRARVQVFSRLDLDAAGNMRRFVRQIQALAPHATGDPVMMVEGGATVAHAFLQASLLAFAFVTILLLASLGSLRDCIGVLLPLLLAALFTAAIMGVDGMSLNLANIIVLPLLAGLGVSYGIYLALGQREGGLRGLFASATPRAVLFSGLTTLCSFGSMAVSGDTAMMMLGKTLAIALGCVLVCVLIVQPALFSLWQGKRQG